MGVQAFDSSACASDSAIWLWPDMLERNERVSFGCIDCVGSRHVFGGDGSFCLTNAAGRFESTNSLDLGMTNEPVARGHGGTVVHQGSVGYDDRKPGSVSNHNFERTLRPTAKKLCDSRQIIHRNELDLSYDDDGRAR